MDMRADDGNPAVPQGLLPAGRLLAPIADDDPPETAEWLAALDYVIANGGQPRTEYLLDRLKQRAFQQGVSCAGAATTPYVNTIPVDRQPLF